MEWALPLFAAVGADEVEVVPVGGDLGPEVRWYGLPLATITGGAWQLSCDNHVGVWILGSGSSMQFGIFNTPFDPDSWKWVWVQVTWQPDFGGQPIVTVEGNPATWLFTQPVGNGGWFQSVYQYIFLDYNPPFENVTITGTIDVGQVVIDTACIPEPSTLALLAVGAVSLLYFSRKRR